MKISINTLVTVQLTDTGIKQFKDFHEDLGMLEEDFIHDIENGILSIPLWEIMEIFGPKLTLATSTVMFDKNELEIII